MARTNVRTNITLTHTNYIVDIIGWLALREHQNQSLKKVLLHTPCLLPGCMLKQLPIASYRLHVSKGAACVEGTTYEGGISMTVP